MPPDDARREDALEWLARVEIDLKAARLEMKTPSEQLWGDVMFMFHAQQAVEKAFKGLLAWHDVTFRKTHNLEELGHQCVAVDVSLAPLAALAAPLTEYAWKFRYPGKALEPDRREADTALST